MVSESPNHDPLKQMASYLHLPHGPRSTHRVARHDPRCLAAGDNGRAHGPLHEVGHLLANLPAMAPAQSRHFDLATVQDATDQLMDLFGKVDDKLHGAEGASYADLSHEIDAQLERLLKQTSP